MARIFAVLLFIVYGSTAQAEVKVLTSIKPIQLIAHAIQGEHGQADVLLPPGASPHSFSLRPSDRKRFAQAELFYWIGPDMENFLIPLVQQHASQSTALQGLAGLELLQFAHTEDDEDRHEHEHSHGLKEHDHHHAPGAVDTHLWLSAHNAQVIGEQIAADLQRLDPARAHHYQTNLARFTLGLQQLDLELQALLHPVREKPFFVFHEAFNYLEHDYGLQRRGVFAINAEVQPGARHIQQIRQRLKETGPSCLFTEPPAPPRIAHSLVQGYPVTLQTLDPLGTDAPTFNALLLNLAQAINHCLAPL